MKKKSFLCKKKRVCHKSVTHLFFIFFLFTDTKSLKNIFIYNKAQTFTSSGFVFPQKSISLQKTSLSMANKI